LEAIDKTKLEENISKGHFSKENKLTKLQATKLLIDEWEKTLSKQNYTEKELELIKKPILKNENFEDFHKFWYMLVTNLRDLNIEEIGLNWVYETLLRESNITHKKKKN